MKTIRKGSKSADAVVMLQGMLNRAGYPIGVDGMFGDETDRTVRDYQRASGLVVDGIVGEQTWLKLMSQVPDYGAECAEKFLSEGDLIRASEQLAIELAAIKAVTEVEAAGQGFIGAKPKILFEGQVFWKRLRVHGLDPAQYRAGNEDVLYPQWTRSHYLGGVREYDRLERARKIQEGAALESASWGLFQIMGYHWKALGYSDIQSYVRLMGENEGRQLDAFTRFVEVNDLAKYIRERQWTRFAHRYNGPRYKENRYDEKLQRAYQRYRA
jgi:hypothetical protein